MTLWFNKSKRSLNIAWYRKIAKRNRLEYGTEDKDIRIGMYWGFHDNGAKKGNLRDSCYDCTLQLGYLEIGYTNWNYNSKLRQNKPLLRTKRV